MRTLTNRVASRFLAAVSKEDLGESTKAKRIIHEWSSELSDYADVLEKFAKKVDNWRDKLPEPGLQAKYYERVDDDLIEAHNSINKLIEKLRRIAHDLGGR